MLFSSIPYILFFLPFASLAYAAAHKYAGVRSAQVLLLICSLAFYGYARPRDLFLLAGSIIFNWCVVHGMNAASEPGRRKAWFWFGLAANVAFLGSFKYVNFFLRSMAAIRGPQFQLPELHFPLGISFFTLTQIMYLVDTYEGLNEPYAFLDHATFVSLFPYMSSGPLIKARSIVPQLSRPAGAESRFSMACRGIYIFAIGLAKKMVFADAFGRVADIGFGTWSNFSMPVAWIFSVAYMFQIYFDFSGYSDMAVGSAWMLGIDIPQNFNAPYRAKSISEFWQRWHISLSNFITSYLYTPILRAMGRVSLRTSVVATTLAMAIAGLWHGPAWTFVIFGTLHGIALSLNQAWRRSKLHMPDWLGWLLTMGLVDVALVFFRSPDVPRALQMLAAMAPHRGGTVPAVLRLAMPLNLRILAHPVGIGIILALFFRSSDRLARDFRPTPVMAVASAALVFASILLIVSSPARQFIYFAF